MLPVICLKTGSIGIIGLCLWMEEVVVVSQVSLFLRWRRKAQQLRAETYTLYLACKDPRVPWYAKVLAVTVVGYAFSPIDLIPDFVPVLGYLDDLILVPLGIILVLKMIPRTVLEECREKAQQTLDQNKNEHRSWIAAGIIVLIWLLMVTLLAVVIRSGL